MDLVCTWPNRRFDRVQQFFEEITNALSFPRSRPTQLKDQGSGGREGCLNPKSPHTETSRSIFHFAGLYKITAAYQEYGASRSTSVLTGSEPFHQKFLPSPPDLLEVSITCTNPLI